MPAARQANVSHGCHAKFACHGYLPAGRLPRGGRTRLVHRRGCGARLHPVRGVAAGLRAGERVRGVPVRPAAAWRAADRVRAEPAACRYGGCFTAVGGAGGSGGAAVARRRTAAGRWLPDRGHGPRPAGGGRVPRGSPGRAAVADGRVRPGPGGAAGGGRPRCRDRHRYRAGAARRPGVAASHGRPDVRRHACFACSGGSSRGAPGGPCGRGLDRGELEAGGDPVRGFGQFPAADQVRHPRVDRQAGVRRGGPRRHADPVAGRGLGTARRGAGAAAPGRFPRAEGVRGDSGGGDAAVRARGLP